MVGVAYHFMIHPLLLLCLMDLRFAQDTWKKHQNTWNPLGNYPSQGVSKRIPKKQTNTNPEHTSDISNRIELPTCDLQLLKGMRHKKRYKDCQKHPEAYPKINMILPSKGKTWKNLTKNKMFSNVQKTGVS